ncbi:MAG: VOC family protein [Aeromicrobium sp.]
MTAVGSLRSIVLECSHPEPLAEFWSALMDRPIWQREDDWWSLEPGAGAPKIAFQVIDDYEAPAWPGVHGEQQVHLDIEVDEIAPAAARAIELGARQLTDVIDSGDEQWQVFADPAGHPFCFVT